jgi:hypothetical protein
MAEEQTETRRAMRPGWPYGRARHIGGGTLIVFAFYRTQAEAEEAIAAIAPDAPRQFVVFLPHLAAEPAVSLGYGGKV